MARPWKRKFLGFSSQKIRDRIRTSVPVETIKRFRVKMKELFHEGRGRNMERFIKERLNPLLRGWLQYFSLGVSKKQATTLDRWIRRHLRGIIWRQGKTPMTRRRNLRRLGISRIISGFAYNRRGPWYSASVPPVTLALSPKYFRELGLYVLMDNLNALRTTTT